MNGLLNILFLEDCDDDAVLVMRHLAKGGLDARWLRVETAAGFREALDRGGWDLVLSDYALAGFTGLQAVRTLRGQGLDLPFILVSGQLGEDAAVEAMHAGADDFILKGNLGRLIPAIERALRDCRTRREHRCEEEKVRRLQMAIDQTADVVLITDRDGLITYANPAAATISGYGREELVGLSLRAVNDDCQDPAFHRNLWDTVRDGRVWRGPMVHRRKDGALWEADVTLSPVRDAEGRLVSYVCTSRDVTQERALQAQLERNQRLQELGFLAGGIAHDFNNILTPILSHAEMGLARPPGHPALRNDLETIALCVRRAADLIHQILAFSRDWKREDLPLDLRNQVEENLRMIRASLPASIAIETDLERGKGTILGDPTRVHQVVVNLCTNAAQAMRGQAGTLRVALERTESRAPIRAVDRELPPGTYLVLEVADQGKGIEPEILEKIFLPFFTTKSVGEGTGLGLSVVKGILSDLGGGLDVRSQVGVGTTFRVFFPVPAEAATAPAPKEDPSAPGQARVLLAEDDPIIRSTLAEGLEALGYRVTKAEDGREALERLAADPARFDIVVTDGQMPGLTGPELARKARDLRPGLPVLLMSGSPQEEAGFAAPFEAFLPKPLTAAGVSRAIASCFQARAATFS